MFSIFVEIVIKNNFEKMEFPGERQNFSDKRILGSINELKDFMLKNESEIYKIRSII